MSKVCNDLVVGLVLTSSGVVLAGLAFGAVLTTGLTLGVLAMGYEK